MNKHRWQLIESGLHFAQTLEKSIKIYCSSPKKRAPGIGEYKCIRCGSIGKIISQPTKFDRETSGYYYKVSTNWNQDCDEALVNNVHLA